MLNMSFEFERLKDNMHNMEGKRVCEMHLYINVGLYSVAARNSHRNTARDRKIMIMPPPPKKNLLKSSSENEDRSPSGNGQYRNSMILE